MFELTRDWVRERRVFGGRLTDQQTVEPCLNLNCSHPTAIPRFGTSWRR